MHRIANPQNGRSRRFDGSNHIRQQVLNRLGSKTVYQTYPAWLVVRIQNTNEVLQPLCRHTSTDLDAHGVRYATEILNMRSVNVGRSHANPRIMRCQVVPTITSIEKACLRLFVQQMQSLVRRINIGSLRVMHRSTRHRLEKIGDRSVPSQFPLNPFPQRFTRKGFAVDNEGLA